MSTLNLTPKTYRFQSVSDPAYLPFESAQLARSRLTGKIHTISASQTFMLPGFVADRAESDRVYNELRTRIEASGAFVVYRERPTSMTYDSVESEPDAQLRLWIIRFPERVTVICTHEASYRRMWSKLPDEQRARFDEAVRRARERQAEDADGDGTE